MLSLVCGGRLKDVRDGRIPPPLAPGEIPPRTPIVVALLPEDTRGVFTEAPPIAPMLRGGWLGKGFSLELD